jgi:hypothetical protein
MTDNGNTMRVRTLLSVQRAMLGMVTPALVGVAVSWGEHLVRARFLYDRRTEGDLDLVGEMETEVLSDFTDIVTDFSIEVVSSSRDATLVDGEVWAYLRRDLR